MDTSVPPRSKPDIHRLLALQRLLLSFSAIERMVYIPPDAEARENNTEHSFSLAMLAWFLAPHFPSLDTNRLLYLCLAHDILEVYCGDSFSFDEAAIKDQAEREAAAIARLKHDWPDFPALLQAIDEYEAQQTHESKFVTALDRLQPIMMDYLCQGRSWHKLGITFERFLTVKDRKMSISPEVAEYYRQLKDILMEEPDLFPAD